MTTSTRRSLAYSYLDRYASLVVGIVATMVLARLLTPGEVGVYSIAMALLALVSTVRDLGAGQYLLQEKDLTRDRIRAVWGVQLGLGVLLGALVMAFSAPAAAFYREPRMQQVMWLMALSYFINPFGAVTYAWLMREMRYDAVALMRFSSSVAGAATSVVLAMQGFGPVSLAWGAVCATAVNALVALWFRPAGYPWLPGVREMRRVLTFGTALTSSSVITSVASGAPEFLLGKLQGVVAAGFFSRANGLVAMFNRLVTDAMVPVAMSHFAKEVRESRDAARPFLVGVSYITALSWSFAAGIALLAHPIIRLLYGPQWDASVDVARLLGLAMAFAAILPLCLAALVGTGQAVRILQATALCAASTLALVWIGSRHGLMALGAALVLDAAIGATVWLAFARPVLRFEWRDLWHGVIRSFAVAAIAAVGPALACLSYGPYPDELAMPLFIGTAGGLLGLLAGLRMTGHPLDAEVRKLLPRLRGMLGTGGAGSGQ